MPLLLFLSYDCVQVKNRKEKERQQRMHQLEAEYRDDKGKKKKVVALFRYAMRDWRASPKIREQEKCSELHLQRRRKTADTAGSPES